MKTLPTDKQLWVVLQSRLALDGDAKEAIADSKLKQAELNYIDALRTVQYEVRTTLEQYLTVQEQSEVIDAAIITTTNMRLSRANDAFHHGELNPLSLITLQQEVHSMQTSLLLKTNLHLP